VTTLYGFLMREGTIPTDWFARQIEQADKADGDIDTLSNRIAHIRTWTFAANRPDWLADPEHWQGVTRAVEDKLSDALHERLAERFVDRRPSVLMRRLRENTGLETDISKTGEVVVEGHAIGRLDGFVFTPAASAAGSEARTLAGAAQKALAGEIGARAMKLAQASDEQLVLASDGAIRWLGQAVGKLVAAEEVLKPRVRIIADEHLTGAPRDAVQARLDLWLKTHIEKVLAPLFHLGAAEDVTGMARGIAFQLIESLGVLERQKVAEDVKGLDQPSRAGLRKYGVRFGAYNIYIPALLKPTPRALATQLYALKHAGAESKGLEAIEQLAKSGRTSIAADKEVDRTLYRVAGYRVCGERAVRADILERIADIIRPALAWRPNAPGPRPPGAIDGFGFTVVPAMTSLAGCAGEEFASILRALGYRMEQRPKPVEPPSVAPAPAGAAAEAATSVPEAALAPEVDAPAEAPADADAAVAGTVEDAPAESETPYLAPAFEAAAVSADSPMVVNTPAPEPEPAAAPPPESVSSPDEAVAADVSAETASAEIASMEAVAAESIAPEIPEAAAADSAEAAPPTEPELIEVWRPGRPEGQRRQRRPQRPPREAGRRRDYHAPPVTADGTAPAVAQGEGAAASDAIAAAPQGAPGADTAVGEARPPHHRQRHERRDGAERGERAGRPSRPDRPEWSKRTDGSERRSHRGNRQDRGDRPDRDPDLRAKYMKGRGEGGDRRDKAPDPNSPFAKLAALKAQLEGNSKEPN
jgi:ATP-dependent RNA helicase SUPV3L1/SUV3